MQKSTRENKIDLKELVNLLQKLIRYAWPTTAVGFFFKLTIEKKTRNLPAKSEFSIGENMKSLAVLSLLSLSLSAQATFVSCYNQVADQYDSIRYEAGYSQVKNDPDYIEAGTIRFYGRNVAFGPYEEDKLAFHVTGSYHSGWFHNVIIANKITCKIEQVKEAAAE